MLGKKYSKETREKMSEAHRGKYYNEKNYKISLQQAFDIKTMLIKGEAPSSISKELSIPYKIINNILSSNAWSRVIVDGWDDFINNRQKRTRLSKEECAEIYELYCSNTYTQEEIANMYGKSRQTIVNALIRAKES